MAPINMSTTLIAQALSDFDATISVQDVIDIEVDYTANIKVPVDLFNNLIYFNSDQNLDNSTEEQHDDEPDLEVAMDPSFFDNFLNLDYEFDGQTQSFKPPFGTIPYSESKMNTGAINPPPSGQPGSDSQDDLVGKHLGIWICRHLFGDTGFGIVGNFQQLIKNTINKNSDFNASTVRMIKNNGGFLPANDPNRTSNSNGGKYKTAVEENGILQTTPRDAKIASSFQGPNSNNIGWQIIQSGLGLNDGVMFDRLVKSVRLYTEPKRVAAANTVNIDSTQLEAATQVYPDRHGTGHQLMKYGDVLIPRVTHSTIQSSFTHYVASTNPAQSSVYLGNYELDEEDKNAVAIAYSMELANVEQVVIMPEVVYNAWVGATLDLHEFALLTGFVNDDTIYMLTALACENSAVLRSGPLGGNVSENKFQPDIINRTIWRSRSIYFNNDTNPTTMANDYAGQHQGSSVGGLYDREVSVNVTDDQQPKLLGWRVGGITIRLTDKLTQLHAQYLAAWANVVACASYCVLKYYADGIGLGTDGANAANHLGAVKLLNSTLWRVSDAEAADVKLKTVASEYISAETSPIYQQFFDELTSEQLPVTLIGNTPKEQIKNFVEAKYNNFDHFRDDGGVIPFPELVNRALLPVGQEHATHALNKFLRVDGACGTSFEGLYNFLKTIYS
jgi:hypothetical protein